jgi:hypothetical protein
MSVPGLATFCQTLVRSKLLTEAEVSDLRKQARAESPEGFAAWLVEQSKLTRYQADSLLRGKVRFFLGDCKLLELVGSGRMAGGTWNRRTSATYPGRQRWQQAAFALQCHRETAAE